MCTKDLNALLLLILEAVTANPVFTISLKSASSAAPKILKLFTSSSADCPIFVPYSEVVRTDLWLSETPAICYRLRGSRIHLENIE